jgi:NADH-quinone oxidoreductase subunit J
MILQAIFFYLFGGITVASAAMVITARNPVHSVLFLILAFISAAGLFILMGAEFLGLVLVFVYVGAVALLFLSVVMMLDIDFTELKRGVLSYLPIGALIGAVLLVELLVVVGGWAIGPDVTKAITAPIPQPSEIHNTKALGLVLYTQYIYFFQTAGVILLVAMIGAIVLTLHHKQNIRRQNIAGQVARSKSSAIEIVKVKSGQGLP